MTPIRSEILYQDSLACWVHRMGVMGADGLSHSQQKKEGRGRIKGGDVRGRSPLTRINRVDEYWRVELVSQG